MDKLQNLISKISDEELRQQIENEVKKSLSQKKFGLVFEEHIPECAPLYSLPIKVGQTVAKKAQEIKDVFIVQKIEGDKAFCIPDASDGDEDTSVIARHEVPKQSSGMTDCFTGSQASRNRNDENSSVESDVAISSDKKAPVPVEFSLCDIVAVAKFGEPIFPYLEEMDKIQNAPDDENFHSIIQADNFHALQLLTYVYKQKIDCIYIDPPYNTGARDWKYNNNYVDSNDKFRHSKWLSMMEKRLRLAKTLLNPRDSVLICTIDEKEYLHLGCLLEEIFFDARIQMVSSVINPAGVASTGEFYRSNEYLFFVKMGKATPAPLQLNDEWFGGTRKSSVAQAFWRSLSRAGNHSQRADRPNLFYPIYVSEDGKKFMGAGDPLPLDADRKTVSQIEGAKVMFPIHSDGSEGTWQLSKDTLIKAYENHFVRVGTKTIYYLAQGEQQKVKDGIFKIKGINQDNSYDLEDSEVVAFVPSTQWKISSHNASAYGSTLLTSIFTGKRFAYPKSLYAVHDALRFFVANKPNAVILDFFAGSGTTLHAVNLLNAEDGGNRKCIMVTNNEVSAEEEKSLKEKGFDPLSPEWQKLGIAQYVTWPRAVCSIKGVDINGDALKGSYMMSNGDERAMAQGFKSNVTFFKLGFLNESTVKFGGQFARLLSLLWLKAGSFNAPPVIDETVIKDFYVFEKNHFAVLTKETVIGEFLQAVAKDERIKTCFVITNSDAIFKMAKTSLRGKKCFQLYKEYLKNFEINTKGQIL